MSVEAYTDLLVASLLSRALTLPSHYTMLYQLCALCYLLLFSSKFHFSLSVNWC